MIFKKGYLTLLAAFLFTALAQQVNAGTFVRIGFDGGGDEIEIPAALRREINAGSGLNLEVGYARLNSKNQSSGQSTELSFGTKFTERLRSNESILFSRLTLNATHFLHNGRWRFGAGLTYHFGTTLFVDNSIGTEIDYDPAAGFTILIDRMFYDGLYRIGLRGTSIEYTSEDSIEVDGSSIGFYAGAYF